MKSEEITKLITIHPDGNTNMSTRFHGNPSSSCRDISLRTTNVNLMVALKEKSSSKRIHHLGIINVGTKFHGNPSNIC